MQKDTLFLLRPGFEDPAFPGQQFYCWHCAMLEGLLASFPGLASSIEVHRIEWARPRHVLVELAGEEHQSLPLLILREGESSAYRTGHHNGLSFVNHIDAILSVLRERHGVPVAHP